jgi:hypothetical protein
MSGEVRRHHALDGLTVLASTKCRNAMAAALVAGCSEEWLHLLKDFRCVTFDLPCERIIKAGRVTMNGISVRCHFGRHSVDRDPSDQRVSVPLDWTDLFGRH